MVLIVFLFRISNVVKSTMMIKSNSIILNFSQKRRVSDRRKKLDEKTPLAPQAVIEEGKNEFKVKVYSMINYRFESEFDLNYFSE